jgi:glucose-1-phosphate cytidylyltransferase
MISEGKVWSQRYDGFWQCMDTFRDKQILDEIEASGVAPWRLWKNGQKNGQPAARAVVC